jgi:hypothetical protein
LLETVKVNPYVYAGDDPVNMVDLTGKDFGAWWGDVSSCTGSALGSFIQWVGGAIGAIGVLGALPAALAEGVTAPAWAGWAVGIGAALFLGVSVFCIGWGTAEYFNW